MKGKKKNKDSNMQQERNHRISIQTFEEGKPCHFNWREAPLIPFVLSTKNGGSREREKGQEENYKATTLIRLINITSQQLLFLL